MTGHLDSAAAALRAILAARHPEHDWRVDVGPRQRPDADRPAAVAPHVLEQAGAVRNDTDPVLERDPGAAAARAAHDHHLEQAT